MTKAIRDAYGEALLKYGKENTEVVVLDADVSSSTKSAVFGKEFPERFYNCGISEYAMTGMAAGMALNGKIPFVNTFAVFLTTIGALSARAFLSYGQLNVKYAGAYGGLSDSYDGASHQSLEDIAMMRVLPGMTVMVASDEYITDWMVSEAIKVQGPMYIRLSRDACPVCHKREQKYEIGKGVVCREGTDVTIIACGVMVSQAMDAAELLAAQGIQAKVVDMFTIKPLDKELVCAAAKETGAIVTAEEHSIIGGLGSAVAEVLAQGNFHVPMKMVGMQDCHGESGAYDQLLKKYGMDKKTIAEMCVKAVSEKQW